MWDDEIRQMDRKHRNFIILGIVSILLIICLVFVLRSCSRRKGAGSESSVLDTKETADQESLDKTDDTSDVTESAADKSSENTGTSETKKEITTSSKEEKSIKESASGNESDEPSSDDDPTSSGEGKVDESTKGSEKEPTPSGNETTKQDDASAKASSTDVAVTPTQPTTQPTAAPTTPPTTAPTVAPTQPTPAPTQPTQPPETQHQHTWEKYVISEAYDEVVVVTPARDEEIVIPAQEIKVPVTEQHTVCNTCGADLNALVAEAEAAGYTTVAGYHMATAGHGSYHEEWWETGQYTTQVIPEQRFTEHHDAVTQTVHHDTVYGERCSGCGTTR